MNFVSAVPNPKCNCDIFWQKSYSFPNPSSFQKRCKICHPASASVIDHPWKSPSLLDFTPNYDFCSRKAQIGTAGIDRWVAEFSLKVNREEGVKVLSSVEEINSGLSSRGSSSRPKPYIISEGKRFSMLSLSLEVIWDFVPRKAAPGQGHVGTVGGWCFEDCYT